MWRDELSSLNKRKRKSPKYQEISNQKGSVFLCCMLTHGGDDDCRPGFIGWGESAAWVSLIEGLLWHGWVSSLLQLGAGTSSRGELAARLTLNTPHTHTHTHPFSPSLYLSRHPFLPPFLSPSLPLFSLHPTSPDVLYPALFRRPYFPLYVSNPHPSSQKVPPSLTLARGGKTLLDRPWLEPLCSAVTVVQSLSHCPPKRWFYINECLRDKRGRGQGDGWVCCVCETANRRSTHTTDCRMDTCKYTRTHNNPHYNHNNEILVGCSTFWFENKLLLCDRLWSTCITFCPQTHATLLMSDMMNAKKEHAKK